MTECLSLLLSKIENICQIGDSNTPIFKNLVTSALLQMVELVENYIREKTESNRGAVLHDAWEQNGPQYYSISAMCNKTTQIKKLEKQSRRIRFHISAICICVVAEVNDRGIERAYSITFETETHNFQLFLSLCTAAGSLLNKRQLF